MTEIVPNSRFAVFSRGTVASSPYIVGHVTHHNPPPGYGECFGSGESQVYPQATISVTVDELLSSANHPVIHYADTLLSPRSRILDVHPSQPQQQRLQLDRVGQVDLRSSNLQNLQQQNASSVPSTSSSPTTSWDQSTFPILPGTSRNKVSRVRSQESYRRAIESYENLMKSLGDKRKISCYNWTALFFGLGIMIFILGLSFWVIGNLCEGNSHLYGVINIYHLTAIILAGVGLVMLSASAFLYFRYITPKYRCFKGLKKLLPRCSGSLDFPATPSNILQGVSSVRDTFGNTVDPQDPRMSTSSPPPSYYTILRQEYLNRNFGPTPSYNEIILNAERFQPDPNRIQTRF